MKHLSLSLVILCLFCVSCKDKTPQGYIEFQGSNYKKPVPVRYDSNGNGVIDDADDVIEVLGTSLNVNQTPSGKQLYKSNDEITPPGSSTGTGSLVPTGQKLCYLHVQKNCDKHGALYAFETSVNTSFEDLVQTTQSQQIDVNTNGILDYIEALQNSAPNELALAYYKEAAAQAELLIEKAASKQISLFLLENVIKDAISLTLIDAFSQNADFVDISNIQQKLNVAISQAIIDAVKSAGLDADISETQMQKIAFQVSTTYSEILANEVAKKVSSVLITEYTAMISSGNVQYIQGLCPDGYHIPSDIEWMIFEMALGMSQQDLTKQGETVTTRGQSAGVVKKMVEEHGFEFGGYASINGTFAQLGEAGVYWSSTAGTDYKGDYVWVRQIDTSYTGVVRYKHYEKSGLSIRCFKNK